MSGYTFKSIDLDNIFQTGTTQIITNYTKTTSNTVIQYLSQFANLPDQTLGYQFGGVDIGSYVCPKFTKYTTNLYSVKGIFNTHSN